VHGEGAVMVTGDGSVANPYTISLAEAGAGLAVAGTATVDMGITGGGIPGDPYTVSAAVKRSADAGNALTTGTDGALFVPPAAAPPPPAASGWVGGLVTAQVDAWTISVDISTTGTPNVVAANRPFSIEVPAVGDYVYLIAADASIAGDVTNSYTLFANDSRGNTWHLADVTATAPLTITLDTGLAGVTNVAFVAAAYSPAIGDSVFVLSLGRGVFDATYVIMGLAPTLP
jgi:hypothetical protein